MAENQITNIANTFGVVDYIVFSAALITSAAIGVYFACSGNKQKTTKEFLLADGNMSVWPVSMSLFASFMSAISTLGIPSDTYTYGLMFIYAALGFIPAMFFAGHLYIPVFYNLKLTSIYEYLEMRFNRITRIICVCSYLIQMTLYMSVVLYAPSLALSAVTGINVWISTISVATVCIFYTAIGGMKAVMWTDTVQAVIMLAGVIAVVTKGFLTVGWDKVWRDAEESGRLNLLVPKLTFDPNPLIRQNFWSLVVGQGVFWMGTYGASQAQVQRSLTLPSLKKAKIALWINLPLLMTNISLASIAGIIIYSYFRDCDPLTSGAITAVDQLYPLFVMEVLGHIPGFAGLIVAAVLSGSLSTISTGLNSLSAVVLVDLIQPFRKQPLRDDHATVISKVIAVSSGLVAVLLTIMVAEVDGVLQIAFTILSVCGGPILGVFSLGMFFPQANGKGAICGLLMSLIITAWFGFGAQFNKQHEYKYPTSTEGCNWRNSSFLYNNTEIIYNTTTIEPHINSNLGWNSTNNYMYSISYHYLMPLACVVCTMFGLPVSLLTGGCGIEGADPMLISPPIRRICCGLSKKYLDETSDFDTIEIRMEKSSQGVVLRSARDLTEEKESKFEADDTE
ncbi:sodium-coupled monocarboxylate transporter 2-like [Watersipora subatra]|uniref:sodium-coupled monocarboxylate transporter 2-like n=1 Tax=Watersipora subatra TaxID=2589382 RepID=UPI00355B609B